MNITIWKLPENQWRFKRRKNVGGDWKQDSPQTEKERRNDERDCQSWELLLCDSVKIFKQLVGCIINPKFWGKYVLLFKQSNVTYPVNGSLRQDLTMKSSSLLSWLPLPLVTFCLVSGTHLFRFSWLWKKLHTFISFLTMKTANYNNLIIYK